MKTTFLTVEKVYCFWGQAYTVKMHLDAKNGQVQTLVLYNDVANMSFYEALEADKSFPFVKDNNTIFAKMGNANYLEQVLDTMAYIERRRREA